MGTVARVLGVAVVVGFAPVGCVDEGGASSGEDTGGFDDDADADVGSESGGDCIAGAVGCVCAEGICAGVLMCSEDNLCVMGPTLEEEDGDDALAPVLGGLRISLDANAQGETITWAQVSGPAVQLLADAGPAIQVDLPGDLAAGSEIEIEASVTAEGVTLTRTRTIVIREAVFESALPEITDPEQIGTATGLAFNPQGMWVVSREGFVSVFSAADDDDDDDAPQSSALVFDARYELGGEPTGAAFLDPEQLLVANPGLLSLQHIFSASGSTSTYLDALDSGDALGAAAVATVSAAREVLTVATRRVGRSSTIAPRRSVRTTPPMRRRSC